MIRIGAFARRVGIVFCCVALLAGCAGAPARSDPPPSVPVAPPQRLAARWLATDGATALGPAVDGGRLVLVGGRLALVAPDGSVREAEDPAPEPLRMLLAVPSPAGERIVALSKHAVYVLDAPLGPLRAIAVFRGPSPHQPVPPQERVAAGPGFVAVFEHARVRFIDVTTGARVSAFEGAPLLLDVAFRSMTEGVARFAAAGLATTTDGGKTFQPAAGAAATAAMAAFAARDAPLAAADAPPLVRWIARTRTDPREVAVRHGVLVREGEALAAAAGLVARVDLATGAVRDLAAYPAPADAAPCHIERAGHLAWLGCEGARTQNEGQTETTVEKLLLAVDLSRPLAPRAVPLPVPIRRTASFGSSFNATTFGTLGLALHCEDDRSDCLVSLSADGALKVRPFPGGRPPMTDWIALDADRIVYHGGSSVRLVQGASRTDLPPAAYPGDAEGEIVGRIDQAADGELRFVVRTRKRQQERVEVDERHDLFVVRQRLDDAPVLTPIPDADEARIVGDVGWAQGPGSAVRDPRRFWTTVDAGATWREAPRPDGLDAYRSHTSEVGAAFEHHVRVGWGEPLGLSRRPPLPALASVDAPTRGATLRLVCKFSGEPSRAKPLAGRAARKPSGASADEDFQADAATGTWTFRWVDSFAPGQPERVWKTRAPEGAEDRSWLALRAVGGDEALFFVQGPSGATWVVRASGSGGRIAHLAADKQRWMHNIVAAPPRRGEPAAWITMNVHRANAALWAWDSGEPRRVIPLAEMPPEVVLGVPRDGRVPFLALRAGEGLEGSAIELALDAAARPPRLDGWVAVTPSLFNAPCGTQRGMAFKLGGMGVRVYLVGKHARAIDVGSYGRVRVAPGASCLDAVVGNGLVDLAGMRAELASAPRESSRRPATCSRYVPGRETGGSLPVDMNKKGKVRFTVLREGISPETTSVTLLIATPTGEVVERECPVGGTVTMEGKPGDVFTLVETRFGDVPVDMQRKK